ncbi:nuclear transport factor 2 family protein [Nocardioides pacificus]
MPDTNHQDDTTPAARGLQRWHEVFTSRDSSLLPAMIAEDAIFRSPAVHRPQEGRDLVAAYLSAAMVVLDNGVGDGFRYDDEWVRESDAILEFSTTVEGLEVHGIDRITWNADGLIQEFTVMIRPLKALHAVVAKMGEELQRVHG